MTDEERADIEAILWLAERLDSYDWAVARLFSASDSKRCESAKFGACEVLVLGYDGAMVRAPDAKQFAFTLSDEERRMLAELAEADSRSAANWIRVMIRHEHERRFGQPVKKPKK